MTPSERHVMVHATVVKVERYLSALAKGLGVVRHRRLRYYSGALIWIELDDWSNATALPPSLLERFAQNMAEEIDRQVISGIPASRYALRAPVPTFSSSLGLEKFREVVAELTKGYARDSEADDLRRRPKRSG